MIYQRRNYEQNTDIGFLLNKVQIKTKIFLFFITYLKLYFDQHYRLLIPQTREGTPGRLEPPLCRQEPRRFVSQTEP